MTATDVEIAERLSRQRAWLLPVLAVIFLSGQAIYALGPHWASRSVDQLKVAAWLLWAAALLFLLATGGAPFRSREVRALLDDETTRRHRALAYAVGFWIAIAVSMGIYLLTAFDGVKPRESIHVIVTAAIAGALVSFGILEHRAHRDG